MHIEYWTISQWFVGVQSLEYYNKGVEFFNLNNLCLLVFVLFVLLIIIIFFFGSLSKCHCEWNDFDDEWNANENENEMKYKKQEKFRSEQIGERKESRL